MIEYEELEQLRKLSSINEKKDYLQNIHGIPAWLKHNKKAYFEWCTGTGKTMMLCKIAELCEKKIPGWLTYVIVPTNVLKEQFENTLEYVGVRNAKVFTIHSYISLIKQHGKMKCNLLIGDELHSLANIDSIFFSTVIPLTEFDTFAGGSATLEDRHVEYLKKYDIVCCSKFTLQDSQSVGLAPEYTIYCLPVELTDSEKKEYAIADNTYWEHFNYFYKIVGNDAYKLITAILKGKQKVKYNGVLTTGTKLAEQFAKIKSEKENFKIEGGHVFNRAIQYRNAIGSRRKILNGSDSLNYTAIEILKRINEKIIVFCELTESCSIIEDAIGGVGYHTGVKSVKKRKENLQQFIDGKNNYLITCKSIQAGFDDRDLRLILRHSYTSKTLNAIQSGGRAMRITDENKHNKTSVIIYLYINDFSWNGKNYNSQQKKWLKKALSNDPNIEWIQDINEIIL